MAFTLDEDNALLRAAYKNDNYRVMQGMAEDGPCLIFFSGKGLYFPDTEESFRETVLYKDRYEWARVASRCLPRVSRVILIRDVRKCWYATGISEKHDTIEKVITLVKELSGGYRSICIGNSAGGYMAAIAGAAIGADAVYSWGGQSDLRPFVDISSNRFFTGHADDPAFKDYMEIRNVLSLGDTPLFYFYSAQNERDRDSAAVMRSIEGTQLFALDSKEHGAGFNTETYVNMFRCDVDRLSALCGEYAEKPVDAKELGESICALVPEAERYHETEEKPGLLKRIIRRLAK
ncbi:MAG: hypothetical protein K6E50_04215 [Lachnospiraceae bacterium]|nr:hypothetical protein [Lachnospiraceae bacterium]